MNTKTEWFVVLDASQARFFGRDARNVKPALLWHLDHPEGRMRTSEIVSDRPGRKGVGNGARTAVGQKSDPAQTERNRFAHDVADHLEEALRSDKFARLHVLAPPSLLGTLRPTLSKGVKAKIAGEFPLDLAHATTAEVADKLMTLEA